MTNVPTVRVLSDRERAEKELRIINSISKPQWIVPLSHGCEFGLMVDDHCLVGLVPHDTREGRRWTWATHLPVEAIDFIADRATEIAEALQ